MNIIYVINYTLNELKFNNKSVLISSKNIIKELQICLEKYIHNFV